MFTRGGFNVTSISLAALLVLLIGSGQQPVLATDALGGLGNLLGGVGDTVSHLTGSLIGGGGMSGIVNSVPNIVDSATNMVGGITKPVMGVLGSLTGAQNPGLSHLAGDLRLGAMAENPLQNGLQMTSGFLNGLTTGSVAAAGLDRSSSQTGSMESALQGVSMRNNFKREAIASGLAANQVHHNIVAASEMASSGDTAAMDLAAAHHYGASAMSAGARALDAASAASAAFAEPALNGAVTSFGSPSGAAPAPVAAAAAAAAAAGSATGAAMAVDNAVANQIVHRQALAADAISNAHAESAIAGADMVAHGANNARSASLASNAYRQAKLASARDRVNIAGTIQNSARISDAAIATHDAAIKAEDSLLGSELAVDSAATVLDSDAAYIPPVSSSLLRSLPYGRIGLRNIIPKPLTYPSVLLPDVWLNGAPVNYLNVPLRMLPYGIGSTAATNTLWASGMNLANGAILNGQPFLANNGFALNGMVFDPAVAYLSGHLNGVIGSSILPVLANGQLEAQDEIAMANMITMQQQAGAGMSATYQGYGRSNPVPAITGSVSDVNLMPTTTIGTTYPIGSALVIEPRDSYFQDYVDNASSRQNYDERQQ